MKGRKIAYFIVAILIIISACSIYIISTGFSPHEVTSLNVNNNQVKLIESHEEITILTYNIGYGGLDAGWDSYDFGGENTRAKSKSHVIENLEFMVDKIDDINPDIFLLQEVDIDSKRSFNLDQISFFKEKYPNYSYVYAINKDIRWIPYPITSPIGKIQSGIASFSKYNALESLRYSLPANGDFLTSIFDYKWALAKTVFETDTSGDLVVINVKLSPYGQGDFVREEQLHFLKSLLEDEYAKGNYVVVGGDYSHNLPGADPSNFRFSEEWPAWLKNIPDNYEISNFNWQIDNRTATFRSLKDSFDNGRTFLAVTDGFIVSDNIQVEEVTSLKDNFQHSNHNPVTIRLKLMD